MMEGLVDLALKEGETSDPMLARVFFARQVNMYMGGAVLAPWDEIDEDWRTVMGAIFTARDRKEKKDRLEKVFIDARKKHPTFRKYGR